jgi:hypothetical protein
MQVFWSLTAIASDAADKPSKIDDANPGLTS